VSDSVKSNAKKLNQMGGVAVTFSKSVVAGAVATAQNLSSALYEQGSGTKAGGKVAKVMEGPKAQAVAKVGVVSAGAAWEIYRAMAQAGIQFTQDIADATADVVEHKYGADAGATTRDGLSGVTQGVQALNIINAAPMIAVGEGLVKKGVDNVVDEKTEPSTQKAIEAKPQTQAIGDLD